MTHLRLDRQRIAEVDPSALADLPKLTNIYLQHNRLAAVPVVSSVLALRFLVLSHNRISEVCQPGQRPPFQSCPPRLLDVHIGGQLLEYYSIIVPPPSSFPASVPSLVPTDLHAPPHPWDRLSARSMALQTFPASCFSTSATTR